MSERKPTAEQLATIQTPEYQAHLQELVDEPGQITLAHKFLTRYGDGEPNLTPLELDVLTKHSKVRDDVDWEAKPSLYERGDEVTSAYGTLTLKGLISWSLVNKWLVSELTPSGALYLLNHLPKDSLSL